MIIIRKASADDIDLLIKLRIDYLIMDKGSLTEDEQKVISLQLQSYFPKHISTNEFIGFIAEEDGTVASAAFIIITERPAHSSFISGKVGILSNVLTYPAHRRKGLATRVIESIISEAKQLDVAIIDLAATDDGKPLYEKIGFKVSQYTSMRLKLK